MIRNDLRIGNFTSSEIACLNSRGKDGVSLGAPAKKYIKQCNHERMLGKSMDKETTARPLSWGNLGERRVFSILPLEYTLCSQETISHPKILYWKGSPDGFRNAAFGKAVTDTKCPISLESFCDLVDPLYDGLEGIKAMNAIRDNHKDGDKYYNQLISNSILTDCKFAELIVYVPYLSELQAIRDMAAQIDDPIEQRKYYWINVASDDELPYLLDGGRYKNLNHITFEVPEADRKALTTSVYKAGEELIQWPA